MSKPISPPPTYAAWNTDVTTTVTRSVALALVKIAGLEPDERGRYGGEYWQLDEALTVAIVRVAEQSATVEHPSTTLAN